MGTPAQPQRLLSAPNSARREPLPAPPARMSSPLAVSSGSVLSARLEPGLGILRGDVVESGVAMMVELVTKPEAALGVWDAHVRA